ncbi:MAG TPA: kelch repeat-containing protein [Steroidobacteraceae bacterium]|nr:kelch repeat-containing protein [Steroidobacteraceae bacterium]
MAGTVRSLSIPGLIARADHTATVMTDGTVLFAGGHNAAGAPIAKAQIWNPKSNSVSSWEPQLLAARYRHTAQLLADGMVYIAGGTDGSSKEGLRAEEYDPATNLFQPAPLARKIRDF